jgi:hypothetical protein
MCYSRSCVKRHDPLPDGWVIMILAVSLVVLLIVIS